MFPSPILGDGNLGIDNGVLGRCPNKIVALAELRMPVPVPQFCLDIFQEHRCRSRGCRLLHDVQCVSRLKGNNLPVPSCFSACSGSEIRPEIEVVTCTRTPKLQKVRDTPPPSRLKWPRKLCPRIRSSGLLAPFRCAQGVALHTRTRTRTYAHTHAHANQ